MEDGIHRGLSIDEYHDNNTHYSSTQIKRVKRSLAQFKYEETAEKEEKTHFDFGNAFEMALLEPKEFEKRVAIRQTVAWVYKVLKEKPEIKTPKATSIYKELHEKFLKQSEGKYIINDTGKESFDTIELMLASCYKDKVIQSLIKNTDNQISVFWTDPETGLRLKTRPDVCKITKNVIMDVKTDLDGSPNAFFRKMCNLDYPIQASLQIQGVLEVGLMPTVDLYVWLVVEKVPPYNATLYQFDVDDQGFCSDELNYYIGKLARAIEEDNFPGYSDQADNKHGIVTAKLPLWYRSF